MTEVTNAVIVERIDNLCASMKLGFKGVHARQDKTNGSVKLNTEGRLKNSVAMKMVNKVIVLVVTAVVVGGIALVINN